jgi:hypothetical protein
MTSGSQASFFSRLKSGTVIFVVMPLSGSENLSKRPTNVGGFFYDEDAVPNGTLTQSVPNGTSRISNSLWYRVEGDDVRLATEEQRKRLRSSFRADSRTSTAYRRAHLKPANRHVAHVVAPRNLHQRFAVAFPGQRFVALVFGQLGLPAKLRPSGYRTLPTFTGPG